MSDKHTDAQGNPIYQRLQEDGAWRDTTLLGKQAWEASNRQTRTVFRATEGQAQTSAAVEADQLIELAECIQIELTRDAIAETRKAASLLDAGEVRTGMELACDEIEMRFTAQLADSTAPGAMTDARIAEIYEQATSYPLADDDHHGAIAFARALLAAPTAQQSLTAGGAVPGERMSEELRDWITGMSVSMDVSTGDHDAHHRYFGVVSEVMDDAHDKHGATLLVYEATPNFVAAPLPQVQSALDAKRIDALQSASVDTIYMDDGRIIDVGGKYAGDLRKGIDAFVADQQPVTPSGALADNDGGVK